ncbi:MAG: ABC transporter ATP-binding protein [Bacteroidetes bacterium]|nr:MAG: ABC transporter ATP-binding protein [Bacteroidota bacterium]
MISVVGIRKEFGGTPLFSDVSFNINPKDRIGLAGKNGSGKTTLLNILVGNIGKEAGTVVIPEDVTIGYLPQEKNLTSSVSIMEEIMLALSFIKEWQRELVRLESELSNREDYESVSYARLIEEYNHLNERLLLFQPAKLRGEAERILTGLGFEKAQFEKPVCSLSVGWQMRIELGKLLLLKPELLLLDEPTNHLDIESIQWLESFLLTYTGSVVLVSHDRTFLDNVTNRTLEINNGKVYDYKVAYSKYIELRNERLEHQKAAFTNQQKEVKEIEQFIEKFRYKATKAKQVQSRVKQLDKLERVQVEDMDKSAIHFRFPAAPHSGKISIEAEAVTKYYGDKLVLSGVDFQLLRGEKVAFVGKNGEGKTTFVKTLLGLIGHKGIIKLGHKVIPAYYTQDQLEMLDVNNTVFDEVDQVAVGDIRTRLKNILGSFLFQGEDVDKKVKVLSGGEKSRLALAKLLLSPSNFLILDEPTNHLDMVSKDILKSALLDYTGSIIIVSHDRDFLQGLTTKVYEFKNHTIKEHIGDISEYLRKHKLETLKELERNEKGRNPSVEEPVSENKLRYEQRKEMDRQIRKLKNKIATVEDDIEFLEQALEGVNTKLSHPEDYREEIKSGSLYKEHGLLEEKLEEVMKQWEILHDHLERLKQ